MKRFVWLLVFVTVIMVVAGCSAVAPAQTDDDKITVAVGIVPEAAFVEKVAGDLVEVVTMVPPGNSPANYQPTAQEMQQFSEASLYFTLHMPTEDANILPTVTDFNKDIIIVDLKSAVAAVYPLRSMGEGDDPHIWLSPKRAMVMVQTIADELCALDETNRDVYQANAASYIAELEALDEEIEQKLSNLTNKSFLLYHAAYGYFADDYGLTMVAIEIEGKQATADELQDVIDYAKENNITTVFYQEEFSDSQAKTVAQEIGGAVMVMAPLSADFVGSLRNVADALVEAQWYE